MRRLRWGYSIVELIFVVAIIGLLAAIGIPNFIEWLHQYRLQSATTTFVNHLQTARLLAIFNGREYQLQIKTAKEGNYYQIVEDPEDSDEVVMSIGRVTLDERFGEVLIRKAPKKGAISFFPRGTVYPQGTIVLENSVNDQVKIVVHQFGRVRSEWL